jgi:hypothetical protein
MPKSKKKKRRLVKSISAQDIPYFKYRVEWIDCVSDSGVKADAPRAVKLYESSQMEELLTMGHAARPLVQDDWNAIQEALIAGL